MMKQWLRRTKEKLSKSATDTVKKEIKKTVSEQMVIYAPVICAVTGLIMTGMQSVKPKAPAVVNVETIHIERIYIRR